MIRILSILWLAGFLVTQGGFAATRHPKTARVQVTAKSASAPRTHKARTHAHHKRAKKQNQANDTQPNAANPGSPGQTKN